MKLPIEKEILEAADGNQESKNELKKSVIRFAEKWIKEDNLDQYEMIEKEDLIKCALLGSENLLKALKNHRTMNPDDLAENANYRELHMWAYREMISFIKLAHSIKKKKHV